jgi:hypothetical protein
MRGIQKTYIPEFQQRIWKRDFNLVETTDMTMAISGMGGIGSAVAARALRLQHENPGHGCETPGQTDLRGHAPQADVVYPEPYPATGAYCSCPNLIMTQHTGGFAPQRQIRLMGLLAENVRRYTSGLPLMNVMDKQRGYRAAKRFDFNKGEIHEFQTNAHRQRSLCDAVPDCRSGGTSATTGRRAGEDVQYRESEIAVR